MMMVFLLGARHASSSRRPSELHAGVPLRGAHLPHAVPARLRAGRQGLPAVQVPGPLLLHHVSRTAVLPAGGDAVPEAALSACAYL